MGTDDQLWRHLDDIVKGHALLTGVLSLDDDTQGMRLILAQEDEVSTNAIIRSALSILLQQLSSDPIMKQRCLHHLRSSGQYAVLLQANRDVKSHDNHPDKESDK